MSRRFPVWALLYAAVFPLFAATGNAAALLIYFYFVPPIVLPVLVVANVRRPIDGRVGRYFALCILAYAVLVPVLSLLPGPVWLRLTLWGATGAIAFLTITKSTVLSSLRWRAVWIGGLLGGLLGIVWEGQVELAVILWNLAVTGACFWGDSSRSMVEPEADPVADAGST